MAMSKSLKYPVVFFIAALITLSVFSSDSSAERLYVTNAGNNTVSVVDIAKSKVVMTLRVGVWPADIAVDKGAGRVYVVNSSKADNSISVINAESNKVIKKIKESLTPETPYNGSPWGVAVF